MNRNTFWTKDFICCSAICFLINLAMYVTMVVIVTYASGSLGVGTGLAGLASGAFIIGALLGRLFIGEGVERIGLKKVLWISAPASVLPYSAPLWARQVTNRCSPSSHSCRLPASCSTISPTAGKPPSPDVRLPAHNIPAYGWRARTELSRATHSSEASTASR